MSTCEKLLRPLHLQKGELTDVILDVNHNNQFTVTLLNSTHEGQMETEATTAGEVKTPAGETTQEASTAVCEEEEESPSNGGSPSQSTSSSTSSRSTSSGSAEAVDLETLPEIQVVLILTVLVFNSLDSGKIS